MTDRAISVVDLFCGAGGLSLGLKEAGLSVVAAVDVDASSLRTYRSNLGEYGVMRDLSADSNIPRASVIVGGPPCQSFSSAGKRDPSDERSSLVSCFASIVARELPWGFIFENVEGFLTAAGGQRVLELLEPLVEVGYRIHLRKINAANYGVPQHRKRVIAIGGLGWTPRFPYATHSARGAPGARLVGSHLPASPCVAEVLKDLPPTTLTAPGEPEGHFARPLGDVDLERARRLSPGQMMRDLPEDLQHVSYRRRANRRVMDGTPTERRGGAPAGLRRLHPDEPSKAITSGARSEFLHPEKDRYLTIRECARLQTFPDWFIFSGTITQQMQQIGNAVPPLLAKQLGLTLAEQESSSVSQDPDGALVTFVPTESRGMSPALAHVTKLVRDRFSPRPSAEPLSLWR